MEPVVVVGAGIAGCMAAIYLAESGYQVTLIEKKAELMLVSSKIPVHLHSGGMYINDSLNMNESFDCLRDSINFMKALSTFAVVKRPTAFAIILPKDDPNNLLPNGETHLADEAIDLYCTEKDKDRIKDAVTSQTLGGELTAYKEKIRKRQQKRWETLKQGFEQLKQEYQKIVAEDAANKVFDEPENFFNAYSQEEFRVLGTSSSNGAEPLLEDKVGWAKNLAVVTDSETIVGVIISSELGLNMFRTRAGLEAKIDDLESKGKLTKLLQCKVTEIERKDAPHSGVSSFSVTFLDEKQESATLPYSQVINATGYFAKDFDRRMGYEGKWAVDIKGAGIVQIKEGPFQYIPEVYFTQAKGMCHFSTLNKTLAGINYAVFGGTYVLGGKVDLAPEETVAESLKIQELETTLLDEDIKHPALLERTSTCIDGCSQFMPTLKQNVTAKAFLPGALGIPGELTDRSSHYVYFSKNGYHSINIVKGGAAVSTAMILVKAVEYYSEHKKSEDSPNILTVIQSGLPSSLVISFDPKLQENILEKRLETSEIGQVYKLQS